MGNKKVTITAICVLILCVIVLSAVCLHYRGKIVLLSQQQPVPADPEEPGETPEANARLSLTVEPETPEEAAQLKNIEVPEPLKVGEQRKYHPYVLEYQGVSAVIVHLSSGDRELREAVSDGDVSLARLVAQAEEDAAQGLCEQWFTCEEKDIILCWTMYRYPGYTMGVMTDMYEDALREEGYLFKYVVFAPADTEISGPVTWRQDEDTFASIHSKVWGLTVSAQDVTPTGLTLHCVLSDEWFDGELYLGDILGLARETGHGWETLRPLTEQEPLNAGQIKALGQSIPTGGDADYPVSWEEIYGPLESGTYNLRMNVRMGGRNGGAIKVTFTIP